MTERRHRSPYYRSSKQLFFPDEAYRYLSKQLSKDPKWGFIRFEDMDYRLFEDETHISEFFGQLRDHISGELHQKVHEKSIFGFRTLYDTRHYLARAEGLSEFDWAQFRESLGTNWRSISDFQLIQKFIDIASPLSSWVRIVKPVIDAGWLPHYFTFVNPDHVLMKARFGQLELTPESFEQAAHLEINNYPEAVRVLCHESDLSTGRYIGYGSKNIFHSSVGIGQNPWPRQGPSRPSFGGWSKQALIKAIRKIGQSKFSVFNVRHGYYRLLTSNSEYSDLDGEYSAPSGAQICRQIPKENGRTLSRFC